MSGIGAAWRKSTFSAQGDCVQVAPVGNEILVRDSKRPGAGHLRFTPSEWQAFLAGVRHGEFDLETLQGDAR